VYSRQIEGVTAITKGALAILERWAFLEPLHVYVLERAPIMLESRAVLHFREVHRVWVSRIKGASPLLSLSLLGEERTFGGLSCDVYGSRMLVHALVFVLVVELKAGIWAFPVLKSRALIDPGQADYFYAIERAFAIVESRTLLDTLCVYMLEGTPVLESRAILYFREVHRVWVSRIKGASTLLSLSFLGEERAFGGLSCDV